MEDQSHLDKQYFIDRHVYNCPFCNRGNVSYSLTTVQSFDWTNDKECHIYLVQCESCKKTSLHLSDEDMCEMDNYRNLYFTRDDLDLQMFYSVPTSFFTVDNRIPRLLRELIVEGDGCLKMNFLTGASACIRKSIYELLIKEHADGDDYESRIKSLKLKYPAIDPTLFDILVQIKDMTSDKIHEQSWDKWDSKYLRLLIGTLKSVYYEIYVLPEERKKRSTEIQTLRKEIEGSKVKPPESE